MRRRGPGPGDERKVRSGAGGGQSAFTLTMHGVKVLMLEAGRNYDPATETPMFQTSSQMPLRGMATREKPFGFADATVDGGWEVPNEPYTQANDNPEDRFWWWRARMLGGRTNHWGRISLRNGPYDFKPYSRDGLGFDWPIGYDDLAPYYDKTEMLVGIYGTNEGLENTPDSSPGCLLPPPKMRAGELLGRVPPNVDDDPDAEADADEARHQDDERLVPTDVHRALRSRSVRTRVTLPTTPFGTRSGRHAPSATSLTRTRSLPVWSPVKSRLSVSGARSSPSTTSTAYWMRPSSTSGSSPMTASGNRST